LETIKERRDGEIKCNGDRTFPKIPSRYFLQKRYSENYIKEPLFRHFDTLEDKDTRDETQKYLKSDIC